MNDSLKRYIEENILPQYEKYDKAHQRDHIETVITESINLAQKFDADIDMAYTIAAYHDLGIPQGRDTHHLTSARCLLEDAKLKEWSLTSNSYSWLKQLRTIELRVKTVHAHYMGR